MSRTERDRGSTSLAAIGLVAVTATIVTTLAAVGAVSAEASRAQGAADACALAAASEARDLRALGSPQAGRPCDEAELVAREWTGELAECRVGANGTVTVTVMMRSMGIRIIRSARAGTG